MLKVGAPKMLALFLVHWAGRNLKPPSLLVLKEGSMGRKVICHLTCCSFLELRVLDTSCSPLFKFLLSGADVMPIGWGSISMHSIYGKFGFEEPGIKA